MERQTTIETQSISPWLRKRMKMSQCEIHTPRVRHHASDLKNFVTTIRPSARDRRDMRTNVVADPRA